MTNINDFNDQMIEQFRANGGRLEFGPASLLLLTTTGAKSGRKRVSPLAVFDDDGRIYVIASKGGAPAHPAWFHNLVANPTVNVEHSGESYDAKASVVPDDQHDELYARIAERFPQFGEYQRKTTRKIPVIALERVG
ncbi:MAG: nitroreductase family deazaflavin-dependent oxidoreductase [Acidimicrobiia bacterium]